MAWRWGSQIVAQVIAWSSTIMVVRLLTPTDYGLFAMTQVVLTALAFLSGHGFASSLIQTDDVSRRRIGQVFGLLLLFNGSLAVIQFLSAPMMASYYDEPLVADMLRIQAVMFLTIPFTALPSELLAKRLEFRIQGKISMLAATLAAIVALVMAWWGYGVWALVYAPISGFVFRAIALTIAARSLVPPVFDLRGARDILHFGGALTVCQMFWIIQSQSDIFIAGRVFDTHDLGLYAEALFLTLIVTGRFLPPINDVAFPAYAELHRTGKSLAPYFLKTLRTVLLVTAPIYFGLALTAEPAVLTLFGEKWVAMAPIAAGLALAMPAMAIQIVCSPVTNAMGEPGVYVRTNAFGAIIFPLSFLVGVASGPFGLVYAWWICAPLLMFWTLLLTLPRIGLTWRKLFGELSPIMLANGTMVLAVLALDAFLPDPAPFIELLAKALCGAAVYGLAIRIFWPHLIAETWAMLRQGEPSPAVTTHTDRNSAGHAPA
ncbi:lipopolysaccharide biosynthesis protein [Erythrobacter litoralis]|uniref:Capsular polysaccharide repeat unit transporter n=1 Tax=Erythrobacter litoralis (strain HTCC2594) TaxID=314225 RepID=Q2NDU9_ERYLH|nr:lipopolysaccharide biosynthesis protein [Erythrobacter litoralis]ABC62142.1 capsular polysaccharide repeat unit transporter [Erythrobacter litoralis HTCC2594]